MAKRMTLEEATQRIIDRINLKEDAGSESIDKYMKQYSSIRELDADKYEEVYRIISESLFGHWEEPWAEEPGTIEEESRQETGEEEPEINLISPVEEAERAWMEAADEDGMKKAVFQLQCLEPDLELVPVAEETALIPAAPIEEGPMEEAIQEAEAELADLENVREESDRLADAKETAKEVAGAIWDGAKAVGRFISKVAPVVGEAVADGIKAGTPAVAGAILFSIRILADLVCRFGLVLMDIWYWLTTYIPIGARRAWFWLTWDAAPVAGRAAMATARFSLDAISLVGGWALACILWTAGAAVAVARGLAYGWRIRESILAEDRRAA